jgi:hypothetical protein
MSTLLNIVIIIIVLCALGFFFGWLWPPDRKKNQSEVDMTNGADKKKNDQPDASDVVLIVASLFLALLVFWLWGARPWENVTMKPTASATPLPIIAGPFKQDTFTIYELEHGWMVMRSAMAGDLFFVPKPSKQE